LKPLISHLEELRSRFITFLFFFFILFILGVIFSPYIIKKIIYDLALENINLVTLAPLEFIYTQLKVGFFMALFLSSPLAIYQTLIFLKPALKKNELNAVRLSLFAFLLLFFAGIYFGYKVFLKISLFFLANLSSLANIPNMWSIYTFISFIIITCLSLGIIFQLPLLLILLKKLNILNEKLLSKKRPYVYVIIFIIAALLTPPDIITQILIACPLVILYELSIFLMKLF
jgi:sec-independent protein translocase protein TatC